MKLAIVTLRKALVTNEAIPRSLWMDTVLGNSTVQ